MARNARRNVSTKRETKSQPKPKTTKQVRKLNLKDQLCRLTHVGACQLFGKNGNALICQGNSIYDSIDIDRDVYFRDDLLRLKLSGLGPGHTDVVVTMTLTATAQNRSLWNYDVCVSNCEHIGAVFALILEDQGSLDLAESALQGIPFKWLSEEQLVEPALDERSERAKKEKFRLKSTESSRPWTNYVVTSVTSGKSYRMALRGKKPGISYCSCSGLRTNTLATCKHIVDTLNRVRAKFAATQRQRRPQRKDYSVWRSVMARETSAVMWVQAFNIAFAKIAAA